MSPPSSALCLLPRRAWPRCRRLPYQAGKRASARGAAEAEEAGPQRRSSRLREARLRRRRSRRARYRRRPCPRHNRRQTRQAGRQKEDSSRGTGFASWARFLRACSIANFGDRSLSFHAKGVNYVEVSVGQSGRICHFSACLISAAWATMRPWRHVSKQRSEYLR